MYIRICSPALTGLRTGTRTHLLAFVATQNRPDSKARPNLLPGFASYLDLIVYCCVVHSEEFTATARVNSDPAEIDWFMGRRLSRVF